MKNINDGATLPGAVIAARAVIVSIFAFGLCLSFCTFARSEQSNHAQGAAVANNEDLNFNKAFEMQKKGNIDEAMSYYRKQLAANPGHVQSWFNLGYAYEERKDYGKAAGCFEKTLQLKPDYYEANIRLAESCEKGNLAKHISDFTLAFSYQKLGDLDNAVKYYIKSLNKEPGYSQTWFNLGYAFMDRKEYRRAVDCFKITLKLKPDYYETNEHILFCTAQLKLKE